MTSPWDGMGHLQPPGRHIPLTRSAFLRDKGHKTPHIYRDNAKVAVCLASLFLQSRLLERKITPRTKLICLLWQNCAKTVSLAGKKLKKRTSASFTRCHYEWSQEDEASKTFIHLHWAVCVFGSLNTKHCLPGCLSLGLISVSTGIALKVVFAWVNDCLVTNLLIISHSLQLPACSVHRSLYGVTAVMWLYYKSGCFVFFVFFWLAHLLLCHRLFFFGIGTAKQTKVTLSVLSCLKCSFLTTFEKMPNSIIFGVYCHPAATKSSADITSNLISLPEGSDPGLKSHCLLKDKHMSYSIWSNKHSGYALWIPYQSRQVQHGTTPCYQSFAVSCWCSLRTQCDHFFPSLCLSLQAHGAIMQLPTSGLQWSLNNQ